MIHTLIKFGAGTGAGGEAVEAAGHIEREGL